MGISLARYWRPAMQSNDIKCRSCKHSDLKVFFDLGDTPLVDRFLTEEQLKQPEPRYPLQVAFCSNCSLVQILKTVPPEEVFCDAYSYYSSFSPALLRHSEENVHEIVAEEKLDGDSLVIELASNDGYLLQYYVQKGIPCLGIDPANGPAKAAEEKGVPTLNTFFTKKLAEQLKGEGKTADVIHGNNVLAHVADTNGFVLGIKTLLKENGVAVIEIPYVRDLVDHCEFDTIYHEHLCYFSVSALDSLFRQHQLYLNEVKRLSIHGGSLRLYIRHQNNQSDSVTKLIEEERALGIDRLDYFSNFSDRARELKSSLQGLLTELKSEGKTIAAYGAAAKGSTLINYVDIGKNVIDFVVDRTPHKHGLHMPGKYWPIFRTEKLIDDQPDYLLILAWNFVEEILEQQQEYRRKGGKFIIPIPEPKIV